MPREMIFPREYWAAEGEDGRIPVFVVTSRMMPLVAATWEEACEFLRSECDPEDAGDDAAEEGYQCSITIERRTWDELSQLGEWSP